MLWFFVGSIAIIIVMFGFCLVKMANELN
jgi:hypothetical protein